MNCNLPDQFAALAVDREKNHKSRKKPSCHRADHPLGE
jgi:hypothetical protein